MSKTERAPASPQEQGTSAGPGGLPDLVCADCTRRTAVDSLAWRCSCGGILDVVDFRPRLALDPPATARCSLWRYESVLPLRMDPAVSLGEGMSPLIPSGLISGVLFKLDFLMPTLSFKDRGAVVLATLAKRLGARTAIIDSSGNAGTAVAAYFARAGLSCEVLVPADTSPQKLTQMRAHGATVRLVPGDREDTAAAARADATQPGLMYASHVYHPYFLHGVKTFAYELWEQGGGRLPETVVLPVGNGTLVLGCHLAFREMLDCGLIERLPTVIGVQTEACSPLETAMALDQPAPVAGPSTRTAADGIAIATPPRGRQILAAIRATGGTVVAVREDEIAAARRELAAQGLFVEATSAVCWAAVRAANNPAGSRRGASPTWRRALAPLTAESVVLPLCGAGLKFPKSPSGSSG